MQINRRAALNGLVCGTAGIALGAPQIPAYFSFFGAPVRPDRYTRNMAALTASQVVTEPSLCGGHSLEMEFWFSEKDRSGTLLWDLAPVHLSRVRFHVFNPNPPHLEIVLKTTFADSGGRQWLLEPDGRPLRPGCWTEVDSRLDAHSIDNAVFVRVTFRFSVRKNFPVFGAPLLLYLNGLECF